MKDLKNFFYNFLSNIAYLSPIPKLFYMTLSIIFTGIVAYRILLTPSIILFLGMLLFTFYIKDLLHRTLLIKYFGTIPVRNFFSNIDPLSLLVPISYTLLNSSPELLFLFPVIIWGEPLIVRRRAKSKIEELIGNFLSSFIHLLFLTFGIALMIVLQRHRVIDFRFILLGIFNLKSLLSYLVFYFIIFNLNYLIMNMIPISPFDMGVAFERIGRSELSASINRLGNVLIFFLYYMDVIPYIGVYIHKLFYLKILANYLK